MQIYKAPLKDYKFLIKDFLNSGSTDLLFKNSGIDQSDLEMILDEAAKLCEEILLPINQSADTEENIRATVANCPSGALQIEE